MIGHAGGAFWWKQKSVINSPSLAPSRYTTWRLHLSTDLGRTFCTGHHSVKPSKPCPAGGPQISPQPTDSRVRCLVEVISQRTGCGRLLARDGFSSYDEGENTCHFQSMMQLFQFARTWRRYKTLTQSGDGTKISKRLLCTAPSVHRRSANCTSR